MPFAGFSAGVIAGSVTIGPSPFSATVFEVSPPSSYVTSDMRHTATGLAGAANTVIRAVTTHTDVSGNVYWLEALWPTKGEPRFCMGLAAPQFVPGSSLGQFDSLNMYFNAADSTPAYFQGNRQSDTPVLSNSQIVMPANHCAMKIDEAAGTVTFYGGGKESRAYTMQNDLRSGVNQTPFMALGQGDVCTWCATTVKPAGAIDWG